MLCAVNTTRTSGQKAIARKINDSDPQARVNVGSKDNLVRVTIEAKLDSPQAVRIALTINNGHGERVYHHPHSVFTVMHNNDGELFGTVNLNLYKFTIESGLYNALTRAI